METKEHICPVWIGYVMNSPLRRLQQDPFKLLGPYVRPGMNVLEVGPAMGFFSIPMAAMTKPDGKVYVVEIQQRMLDKLMARARKKKLKEQLVPILADINSSNIAHLKGEIDFCLLAFVVHEIPDRRSFFKEVAESMKPGGKVLFMEPGWHVSKENWESSLQYAREAGFKINMDLKVSGSKSCEMTFIGT